jgi:hypothetical protein
MIALAEDTLLRFGEIRLEIASEEEAAMAASEFSLWLFK